MSAQPVDVLADLRGVVRIAKAASIGVSRRIEPRIQRAEKAIAAVAELIDAADAVTPCWHCEDDDEWDRLGAALARVQGGAA